MHKHIRVCGLVALTLAVGAWTAVAAEEKTEEKSAKEVAITVADLPAAVRATIDKEIPGATLNKIEKEEENGKVLYDIEGKLNGKDVEMDIAADGKVLTREDTVSFASMPAAVRAAAEKYFGGPGEYKASKEVEGDKAFYEVEGKKDGKKVTLKYTEDGKQVEEEKE